MFTVGSHLFKNNMIDTIENEETETPSTMLSYDETFALFSAISQDITLMTERVDFYKQRHDHLSIESLEFWSVRLDKLVSVRQKLKTGFQINPMFTNIW
jgi:hypothetical protein